MCIMFSQPNQNLPINQINQLTEVQRNETINCYRALIDSHLQAALAFQQQFTRLISNGTTIKANKVPVIVVNPTVAVSKSTQDLAPMQQKQANDLLHSNHTFPKCQISPKNEELPKDDDPRDTIKCQILSVNCPQKGCNQKFLTKSMLDDHLEVFHNVLHYRCLLQECGQSFSNSQMLYQHFQLDHGHLTKWPCYKCSRNYQSHAHLQYHFRNYHQHGKFICSYQDCSFIGPIRADVYTHYEQCHQKYLCTFPHCDKSFRKMAHLKTHQRVHLGLKAYRCKWPGCSYASEDRSNAIKHIRIMHFRLPVTKKEQRAKRISDARNPKDYLEIMSSLLKQ